MKFLKMTFLSVAILAMAAALAVASMPSRTASPALTMQSATLAPIHVHAFQGGTHPPTPPPPPPGGGVA